MRSLVAHQYYPCANLCASIACGEETKVLLRRQMHDCGPVRRSFGKHCKGVRDDLAPRYSPKPFHTVAVLATSNCFIAETSEHGNSGT